MSEKDRSLVGCYTCGRGFPLDDMYKFDIEVFPAYVCEDCQQQYQEKWPDKPKEPK